MNKKKWLVGALVLFFALQLPAQAKLYKWVDDNGTVHFSQTPPPNQTKQKFETKHLKTSRRKADGACCMELRQLADRMATALDRGANLLDLHNAFQRHDTGVLTEIANFVSHKHGLGLNRLVISKMAYDSCVNAKFMACSTHLGGGQKAESSGTGFLISKAGQVLTNAHVVDECKEIRVGDPPVPGALLGKDSGYDLALLETSLPTDTIARFRRSNQVALGEAVVVLGYPLSGLLSSGPHVTTGTISALGGLHDNAQHVQITAPVQPGNSGGPLLDSSGNIVGVVVARLNDMQTLAHTGSLPQNINFAINLAATKQFLQRFQVDYLSSEASPSKSVTDVSQVAKRFTVPIRCLQ